MFIVPLFLWEKSVRDDFLGEAVTQACSDGCRGRDMTTLVCQLYTTCTVVHCSDWAMTYCSWTLNRISSSKPCIKHKFVWFTGRRRLKDPAVHHDSQSFNVHNSVYDFSCSLWVYSLLCFINISLTERFYQYIIDY